MSVHIKNKFPTWAKILRKVLRLFRIKILLKPYLYIADSFLSAADHIVLNLENDGHPKINIIKYYDFFISNINKNSLVLDIGSHNGNIAFKLSDYCKNITGIEINSKNYQNAIKNNIKKNVAFIKGDVTTYKFNTYFDVCIMSNVLEHIQYRTDLLKSLLKITNTLLIRVPAIDRDWWPIYRKNILQIEWRCDPTHFIEYTEEIFNNEINESGWQVIESYVQWGEIYAICKKL